MAEINNSLALGIKNDAPDIGKTLLTAGQINALRTRSALEEASTAQTQQQTQYNQFQQDQNAGYRVPDVNTLAEANQKQADLRGRAANEIFNDPSNAGVKRAFQHWEAGGAPLNDEIKQKILAMPPAQRRQTAAQIRSGSMPSSTNMELDPNNRQKLSYGESSGRLGGETGGPVPPIPGASPPTQSQVDNAISSRKNINGTPRVLSLNGNVPDQPGAPVNPLRNKGITEANNAESHANAVQNSAEFTKYKAASDSAPSIKNSLRQIIDDSDRAYTGPVAERVNAANRAVYAMTKLPGVGSLIEHLAGDKSDPVAALENIRKNVGIISRQAVGDIGERSAAALESVQKSIPTEVTSHKGILQAANQFMAVQDFNQARTIEATKWLKKNGSMDGFAANWTQNMGPAAFVMARLPREEQIAVRKRMSATAEGKRSLDSIDKQIDWAKEHGLGSVID